jgi:hypothetical protein
MESKSCGVLDIPLEPVIGLAEGETRWRSMTGLCEERCDAQFRLHHSGMARQRQTSDAQLRIGESRDSGFDAEPVIGPRFARTRWHRPGMTAPRSHLSALYSRSCPLSCAPRQLPNDIS